MKFSKTHFATSVVLLFTFWSSAQTGSPAPLPYVNAKLSTEERVADLVSRLNLSQKIKLLMYRGTAVDSAGLHIPAYNWWNECLHGVARAGKATVFPQTVGLAATWDTALIYRVSSAISDEARAKYNDFSRRGKRGIYQGLNFWTPNINIFRDPRWGRGMETYGEDPVLTGTMASQFIKGLQGTHPNYFKAIATVKHFVVHSGPEATRGSFDAWVSDRDLWETYTPAFRQCLQEARAYSVMCAYNRFRGEPCCGNPWLLQTVLRKQWGFKGFIVTDCGAVNLFYKKGAHEVVKTPEEASALAIKSGVDLECGDAFASLDKAVSMGLLSEADIDEAVSRLFTARFKLGFFDEASKTPYNNIPYSVVESEANKKLALEAAQNAIVLLKNEKNVLPLSQRVKSIAVIGPNAADEEVMLANYHGFPSHVVTPLEGIKKAFPQATILYAKGSRHADEVPSLDVVAPDYFYTTANGTAHGLQASYYNNEKPEGKPAFSRTDKNIDFYWINRLPVKSFDREAFSARWTGYLKPPASGTYQLGAYGYDQYSVYLNDTLLVQVNSQHEPKLSYKPVALQAAKFYKIEVRFASSKSAPHIKLKWEIPNPKLKEEAIAAAKKADVVVVCAGLSPQLEGEEMKGLEVDGFYRGDRTKLALPQVQQELIKSLHALGKPVVLVLVNGGAVAVNWEAKNLPAIVEAWYGGQEGGMAIGNVLSGVCNPSGRLPVTFYASEKDLPAFADYNMQGRTYRYFGGTPLYPFGYGLSYTSFAYGNLRVTDVVEMTKPVTVSATVTNTGSRDGDEVVQLYLANRSKEDSAAIRSLKGFRRIHLKRGESKTVSFTLMPSDFSVIDNEGKRVIKPGAFTLSLGGGQPAGTTPFDVLTKDILIKGKESPLPLN